jgi:hypothetical protein
MVEITVVQRLGGKQMTVCIGAVCQGGQSIVVAADRMFTFNAPVSLEFETGEKKIDTISTSCVVLSVGVAPPAKEIITRR